MASLRANRERRTRRWVRERCLGYFSRCDEEERCYTVSGLRVALEADEQQWAALREDPEVSGILDLALARIRDALEQRRDQMAAILVKTPEYGGGEGVRRVSLSLRFEDGGDPNAYGG